MALATLSIDLVAKLAQFEASMDKAARLADKRAAEISGSLNRIKTVASVVGRALPTMFAVSFAVDVVKGSINAADALNDLSDATGVTIEGLSSLEQTAMLTGTTIDTVGDVLVKFNAVLKEASPESPMAQALKAIGLNAAELRKQSPDEALREVAQALARFQSDGTKARIVQELFGKSTREVASFLKDLAEHGRLAAEATTHQTDQAERFNKQLALLKANSTNVARAMTAELVPAMNEFIERMKDAAGGPRSGFRAGIEIANITRQLEKLRGLRGEGFTLSGFFGSEEAREREIARLEEQLATFKRRPANEGGGGFRLPQLDSTVLDTNTKQVAALEKARKVHEDLIARIRERITLAEGELATGQQLTEAQKFSLDIVSKLADGELKLSDSQKRTIAATLEQYAAMAQASEAQQALIKAQAEAVALNERHLQALQQGNAAQIEANAQLREYVEEIGLTIEAIEQLRIARLGEKLAREEQAKAMLENAGAASDEMGLVEQHIRLLREEIQLRQDAAKKTKALGTDATAGAIAALKEYQDQARRAGDATRDAVRQGIGVLEDDLTQMFKTGRIDVSNFVDYVLQEFLRLQVVRPLLNSIFSSTTSSSGNGGLWGALFSAFSAGGGGGASGSAKGDAFTAAGKVHRFASGGTIVDRRTRFTFGGGQLGEMGEAGPEGILPLQRGPDGRLGVAAHGAGGTNIVNNFTYNVQAGVTRQEVLTLLQVSRDSVIADINTKLRRQGVL